MRASYLEIYNETLKDLLAPETGPLRIRQDEKVRLRRIGTSLKTKGSELIAMSIALVAETFFCPPVARGSRHGRSTSSCSPPTRRSQSKHRCDRLQRDLVEVALAVSDGAFQAVQVLRFLLADTVCAICFMF